MTISADTLPPCPFCGAGTTQIRLDRFWTGKRHKRLSATVMHGCVREEGQPQSMIQIKGKTEADAVRLWTARADTPGDRS